MKQNTKHRDAGGHVEENDAGFLASLLSSGQILNSRGFIGDSLATGASSRFLQNLKFRHIVSEKSLEHLSNEINELRKTRQEHFARRQKKLDQRHVESIRNFIDSNYHRSFTGKEVRRNLELTHPEVIPISDTTVRRGMKNDLGMSYKKLERRNWNTFTPAIVRSFFESAATQLKLDELGIEQIYIDEFSVNSRHSDFYGWSRRGEKRHLRFYSDNFTMSFVIAVSSMMVYGVMGTKETTDAELIEHFVKEMLEKRNQEEDSPKRPFVIVMDNATVHTSSSMRSFFEKSGVGAVTITAYSPALNPCEKAINAVKGFIKQKQMAENKVLSLKMIQDSVDKLSETPAIKFVKASRAECNELMKKFIKV